MKTETLLKKLSKILDDYEKLPEGTSMFPHARKITDFLAEVEIRCREEAAYPPSEEAMPMLHALVEDRMHPENYRALIQDYRESCD